MILSSNLNNCLEFIPTKNFLWDACLIVDIVGCRHMVMIKSRLTFSWFYYYFKILWDDVSQTAPSLTHGQKPAVKWGGGCGATWGGEFLQTSSLLCVLCLQIRFFLPIGFPAEKFGNLWENTHVETHYKHWHFRSCVQREAQTQWFLVGQFGRILRNKEFLEEITFRGSSKEEEASLWFKQ